MNVTAWDVKFLRLFLYLLLRDTYLTISLAFALHSNKENSSVLRNSIGRSSGTVQSCIVYPSARPDLPIRIRLGSIPVLHWTATTFRYTAHMHGVSRTLWTPDRPTIY